MLSVIYDQFHEYRAGWALGVLCVIFLSHRYLAPARTVLKSRRLFRIAVGLGVILTLIYALAAILYLIYPNYIDHAEATVAAISWLGLHGHLIYPNWETGDIYGSPYGPLLFVANGTMLQLCPTIFGSKLAGWTALLVALMLTYIALKTKASHDRGVPFLFLMSVVASFSFFHAYSHAFWSRPEPFLILTSILTIISALKLPGAAAATAIGILAGLAADFKLPGALCAAPAALGSLGAGTAWNDRLRLAMLAAMGAAIAAVPFCLNFGSGGPTIKGYVSTILIVAKHGWSLNFLIGDLLFALLLFAPIGFAWYFRRPKLAPFQFLAAAWPVYLLSHHDRHRQQAWRGSASSVAVCSYFRIWPVVRSSGTHISFSV